MQRILLLLSALWFAGCATRPSDPPLPEGAWEITLSGKVGFPQSGVVELLELLPEGEGSKDSLQVDPKTYTFSKKVRLTQPGYYRLNFYNQQSVVMILNKSDVEVNVDGNNPNGFSEIKGSPEHDLFKNVQELQQSFQQSPELARLEEDFQQAAQARDEARMTQLQKTYQDLALASSQQVADLIRQQPASLAVVELLRSGALDRDQFFDVYREAAAKLKAAIPDNVHAKGFIEQVQGMEATAVGQVAPEIALPNPEGEIVKLSSLRGQYVLVDFWAKWCGPCRRENPNVVKAYQKYKDKGFTVYGVSLDRTREDWLQAIREDNLTWTHVSDLAYFNSVAARDYSINAIPFSILLDPQGVIIAKNLRGPALEQKLAEVIR